MKTVDDFITALIAVNEKAASARGIERELRYFQDRSTNLQYRLDRCLTALNSIKAMLDDDSTKLKELRDFVKYTHAVIFSAEVKDVSV